jgi:hypothetical protein
MKTIIQFIFLLIPIGLIYAQEKRDNIWILGYGTNGPNGLGGGGKLNFSNSTLNVIPFPNLVGDGEITTVCDKNGNLALYASGCEVYNASDNLMENGDSINAPGQAFSTKCANIFNYFCRHSIIALPNPGSDTKYTIFHLRIDNNVISNPDPLLHPRSFLQTKIDMNYNAGLGKVTEKNLMILKDTFAETLTAVRHGNGRDWWIPVHKRFSNKIFLYLFDPTGIYLANIVEMPFILKSFEDDPIYLVDITNVFSPNGNKYVILDRLNGLILADFDRCAGNFSNFIQLPLPVEAPDIFWGGMAAFSPNNRFVYATTGAKLFQYDLDSVDIENSKLLIDTLGPNVVQLNGFNEMLIAPDDKIYMSAGSSPKVMNVINKPNEKGTACEFVEAGFPLPIYANYCLPNIPYYRLGAYQDSFCDTLTTAVIEPKEQWQFRLIPNPTSGDFVLKFQNELDSPVDFSIYNISSQEVYRQSIEKGTVSKRFSLENLPRGLYFYQISQSGVVLKTGRVVKIE